VGSEDVIEGFESVSGENDEPSQMTTWGELENIQSFDVASVNTWKISCSILDSFSIVIVNNEWTLSHDIS